MKYIVSAYISLYTTVEVEAENYIEAAQVAALAAITDDFFDSRTYTVDEMDLDVVTEADTKGVHFDSDIVGDFISSWFDNELNAKEITGETSS